MKTALPTDFTLTETQKIFSSASVLYSSKIFEEMMKFVSEKDAVATNADIDYSNVGRNDKCPCGSGKKYKNCCGKEAK